MNSIGLYIHVPYCLKKCNYCAFYSRGGRLSPEEEERYAADIIEDIRAYGKEYGRTADTVFVGGGTPSILKPQTLERILEEADRAFPFEKDCEITMEANPATLTEEKLVGFRYIGINRLSIGCQSFDDDMLSFLGRAHRSEDVYREYNLARKTGFDNINLDFMFAIPGMTEEMWMDTLKKAVELDPEHLSFYSLQLEEGTPFFESFQQGTLIEVPDDVDRRMYHSAVDFVKDSGYSHYEISNCAKAGYQCRHNLKYWSMDEYLGIGPAASSFMEGARFTDGPYPEYHENTFFDSASEFVFTGLRKTEGISFDQFRERFGRDFWEVFGDRRLQLQDYFDQGKLIEKDGFLKLSLEGIDISNSIMAVFV